ncbi:MAG: hypothetical protein M1821_003115 [Bathelium mastoideum]|nr:MAG: hypothetical protein M1821_003115 [Bathelium mastoideum]KAI9688205.1 MAG: hypothetical protein M1822_001711 [Bathelium mastoideum]
MASDVPNSIIHYHYSMSPYARRITWYLTLRNISHGQCLQPVTMPRPDLAALGVQYRRIPVLSIGRDIYVDTRIILAALERRFPATAERSDDGLAPVTTPAQRALRQLLAHFTIDAGVFTRMAQCIPLNAPLLQDAAFRRDREEFSGSSWDPASYARGRPEALVHLRQAVGVLEEVLADGREWILGTEGPSLGDIEAVWPFDWLARMEGAWPEEVISARLFPRTFAWMERFRGRVGEAAKGRGEGFVRDVKGEEAVRFVEESGFEEGELTVEEDDPTGLKEGAEVQIWPIDSGFTHKDRGRLVGLTKEEVVVSTRTKEGGEEVRIHAPRWGFRIREVSEDAKL